MHVDVQAELLLRSHVIRFALLAACQSRATSVVTLSHVTGAA